MPTLYGEARHLALITGASDGIGAELARVMAARGHDLALTARRAEKLDALADEIAATGRPRPLVIPLDLGASGGADALVAALDREGASVDILVNNAGFGLLGAARDIDRAQQLAMIDLNIRALTDLTLHLLPGLVARRGRILQVASIAAFLPGPYMAVYYASKAYVLSFGEALARETRGSGLSVSTLCPGPTTTGFQARAGMAGDFFDKMGPMTARAVAEAGYAGMMAGRRIILPGWRNRLGAFGTRFLPRAWLMEVVARLQERRKT